MSEPGMSNADFRAFAEAFSAAWAMRQQSVEPEVLRLAFEVLRPWPLKRVQDGLLRHMRDPKAGMHPPQPADIIRQIEGTEEQNQQVDKAHAMAAWQEALEAVRRVGGYEDCPITDPRALAAIEDAGGWASFCMMESGQLTWHRKQFIDAYLHLDAPKTPRAALGVHSRGGRLTSGPASVGELARQALESP